MRRTSNGDLILFQRKQTACFSDELDGQSYKKTFVVRLIFCNGLRWEIISGEEMTSVGDFCVRVKRLSDCIFYALRIAEAGHTECYCRLRQAITEAGLLGEVTGNLGVESDGGC